MEEKTENKSIQPLLKLTYVIIPLAAGADKFTNLLADWEKYLNPMFASMLPFSSQSFMQIVGVIEMIAGIFVLINPQKGAWLVCTWLVLIALSLITSGSYLDIAVRDLAMAVGAYSLARISQTSRYQRLVAQGVS